MVEALALESFLTSVACLCASSYGPHVRPQVNLKENIAHAMSSWDRDILQIFINSNQTWSFNDENNACKLPAAEDLNARLHELENQTERQKKEIEKLQELNDLRPSKEIVVVEINAEEREKIENEIQNLNKSVKHFEENDRICKLQHENDQKEISNLHAEITKLNMQNKLVSTTTPAPSTPTPPPAPVHKNGCLLTKKHGVSNIEISIRQNVFCAKDLDSKYGDGWMLVSQRFEGLQHFYIDWKYYVKGFGKYRVNAFFVGFDRIFTLTNNIQYELLFVLTDIYNQTRYAHYDDFSIGNESEGFLLKSLGTYKGDAGDSLSYHKGQKFSTYNKNNIHCAIKHTGAWWYKNEICHESNLFGIYRTKRPQKDQHKLNGMIWSTFHNTDDGSLISMRMYIRPKGF